jgi:hypothetical protein
MAEVPTFQEAVNTVFNANYVIFFSFLLYYIGFSRRRYRKEREYHHFWQNVAEGFEFVKDKIGLVIILGSIIGTSCTLTSIPPFDLSLIGVNIVIGPALFLVIIQALPVLLIFYLVRKDELWLKENLSILDLILEVAIFTNTISLLLLFFTEIYLTAMLSALIFLRNLEWMIGIYETQVKIRMDKKSKRPVKRGKKKGKK